MNTKRKKILFYCIFGIIALCYGDVSNIFNLEYLSCGSELLLTDDIVLLTGDITSLDASINVKDGE